MDKKAGSPSADGMFSQRQQTDKQVRDEHTRYFEEYRVARTNMGKTSVGVPMEEKLAAVNAMLAFLKDPSVANLNALLDHKCAFRDGTNLPNLMKNYIVADMKRMEFTRRCDQGMLDAWFTARQDELSGANPSVTKPGADSD